MTELLARLLASRGFKADFLKPNYEDLKDVFRMPDLEEGVDRIKEAIVREEKILIFGDYDVDGVSASIVMYDAIKMAGGDKVEIVLPDRFKDGYGMNERLIEIVKDKGVKLLVTVDCGSNNGEIIEKIKALGIDVIVTDHHEIIGERPKTLVINPKREGIKKEDSLRNLCGAGVAFLVAKGMVEKGMIKKGQEKWLLDMVLIGTVCDSMELVGENRILGKFGLKVIEKTRRKGLIELMKVAGVKEVNSYMIAFLIGPRINAAGRIESAQIALDLLMCKDSAKAVKMAHQLDEVNKKRRELQDFAIEKVMSDAKNKKGVIVESGDFHEGIVGIVAGRLLEEYKKPAFVLTEAEDGILKGSGRSFGEFNLAEAIKFCNNEIIGGGGHAEACGVKIEKSKLAKFREKINEYYFGLGLKNQERFLETPFDLEVGNLEEFSIDFFDEMKELEPFGMGNLEPIFLTSRAKVIRMDRVGAKKEHLTIMIRGREGGQMKLVAFFAKERWLRVAVGDEVEIKFSLICNEWRGVRSVEGRIVDLVSV